MAAVTLEVLLRVLMVESQFSQGSIFAIDVDEREYWITARHIVTGVSGPPYGAITDTRVSVSLLNPNAPSERLDWIDTDLTVVDPGDEKVDLVVLAARNPILSDPLPSPSIGASGAQFGGDCSFLGFPYGGGWRAPVTGRGTVWLPFVKHCTISGHYVDRGIWVLDGINNDGFSGGPVVFQWGQQQRIIGVISAWRQEPVQVAYATSTPLLPKATVQVNSGFIIAFDISHALDLIRKNPIGPLRKA